MDYSTYKNPEEQKFFMGIILMVPCFAVDSFVSLVNTSISVDIKILHDCYESFVMYYFGRYLVACLGGEERTIKFLEWEGPGGLKTPLLDDNSDKGIIKHPFPMKLFLEPWKLGQRVYQIIMFGIVQYMIIMAVTSVLAVILEAFHVTVKENSNWDVGFTKTDGWLYELRDMLAFFGHCKTLTLTSDDTIFWGELIVPDGMRDNTFSPLYDLNHLKIGLTHLQEVDSRLVDSLLWFAPHLQTLCITSCGIEKVMKFEYYEWTMNEDIGIGISCCNNRPIKCWRHYLRKVEMQNFGPSKNEVGLEEYFKTNGMCLETICYN